jgi:acyl-coenzyme A thioesterase PaaI-like protein
MDLAHRPTLLIEMLLDALSAETARAAGAPTEPVSVNFEFLGPRHEESALIARVTVERATRTIVFARADLADSGGRTLMAASAVYRIVAG